MFTNRVVQQKNTYSKSMIETIRNNKDDDIDVVLVSLLSILNIF